MRSFRVEADRERLALGAVLLRLVLSSKLGEEPRSVPLLRRCAACGTSAHGRPYVPDGMTGVSVSHSGQIVVACIAGSGDVGIDVETSSLASFADLGPESILSTRERASYESSPTPSQLRRTWVRKEAVLKATGQGLLMPLHDVEVSRPDEPPAVVRCHGYDDRSWGLYDLKGSSGHPIDRSWAASLATIGVATPHVLEQDASPLLRGWAGAQREDDDMSWRNNGG